MSARLEYALCVSTYIPLSEKFTEGLMFRKAIDNDVDSLARLFLSSYPGTIDYDGQSYSDALEEMNDVFNGRWGEPLIENSWIALKDSQIVSACLMSLWPKRNAPLVCEMMTHQNYKGCGIGKSVLNQVVSSLQVDNYGSCIAFIKAGNRASENLFTSLGFKRVYQ